jgi:hypothetical protein
MFQALTKLSETRVAVHSPYLGEVRRNWDILCLKDQYGCCADITYIDKTMMLHVGPSVLHVSAREHVVYWYSIVERLLN